MNSEELEQSLRAEFESYLKNVLADMRQEFSEFQNKVQVGDILSVPFGKEIVGGIAIRFRKEEL